MRRRSGQRRAIKFATTALELANGGPHHDCKVDATVALGEAQFKAAQHANALHTFTTALSLSRQMANPKWVAACHLHLAESHIAAQRTPQAEKHLKEWHESCRPDTNGFLQAMADDLERKIDEMSKKGFLHLGCPPRTSSIRKQKKRLDDWIHQQLMDRNDGNSTKTAAMLGVSRTTVYKQPQAAAYVEIDA